ncbi:MAG: D-alanyl-D-alanine carboxypeptidase [Clostridia bacterium]|nr:D-alanyl-D-alanine carboxypeptidase [Clostridia bacterium]
MKKALFMLIFISLIVCSGIKISAQVNLSAQSCIVIDGESGRVLFEKNAYETRPMASTTKIMTALVVLEKLELNEMVEVSASAAGTEGSSIWLSPGENMSVEDLLYALMLASGNDAAAALAEYTSGSEAAFALLMNQKAKSIGAYNTNFTNPHGLPDDNHYTTAYDLALISAYAMKNSTFAQIVATENKTISWEGSQWKRSLKNHNKLLSRYEYATGVKTGYTKKAGRCLVSCAEKDGRRNICVTLNAPDDWNDHITLHEYCFENYKAEIVCKKGQSAGVFLNNDVEYDDVNLLYGDDFITSVKEGETVSVKKFFNVKYPVSKNQIVGRLDIYRNSEHIGSVSLVSGNDAKEKETITKVLLELVKGIMKP